MEESRGGLIKSAMSYGLAMGLFWVFKFLFLIFSHTIPGVDLLYTLLSLTVPLIAYFMTKRYKQEIGGTISFSHAWQFGTMLYFFAALVVSPGHFVFYRYLAPPDFLTNALEQMTMLLQQSQISTQTIEAIQQINLTPIHMTIQGIFNNAFYGILLSIPVAAMLKSKSGGVNQKEEQDETL